MRLTEFLKLQEKKEIEDFASELFLEEALRLVNNHKKYFSAEDRWKLSPFFSGMDQDTFEALLEEANDKTVVFLKGEAEDPAIQHHLTLLLHHLEKEMDEVFSTIIDCEHKILTLDKENVEFSVVLQIDLLIESLEEMHHILLKITNRAQQLVWMTDRSDLIDGFGKINEKMQRSLHQFFTKENSVSSTNLIDLLGKVLFQVYGNQDDPSDHEALHDEDPALEGLEKLGIKELSDFFDLGLLPGVLKKQLAVNARKVEQIDERNKLFKLVSKELAQMGLMTVQDLKDRRIFSRQSFEEFLGLRN